VLSKTQQHESGLSQHEQNSLSSMSDRLLATAITNVPAQRVYEALGWKRDEEFYVYSLSLS